MSSIRDIFKTTYILREIKNTFWYKKSVEIFQSGIGDTMIISLRSTQKLF